MSDFLNNIKDYSKALKEACKWENEKISLVPLEEATDDYIFEFLCFLIMIVDLSDNYIIEFVEGKKYKDKFPEKAGLKSNFPRIHLLDKMTKEVMYQLCAGTLIENEFPDQDLYPDISLQTADSPDEPKKEHLLMIWDAKHVSGSGKRISSEELRHFAEIINIYDLCNKPKINLVFSNIKELEKNCLITNGESHHVSNNDSYIKSKGFRLIYKFSNHVNYLHLG